MPEGPEVKRVSAGLRQHEGCVITAARVVSGRYQRKPITNLERLVGATLLEVVCKGKLIVLYLHDSVGDFAALSTLGMSGHWGPGGRHARIELMLEAQAVTFYDTRNFGTFKVVSITEALSKLADLGPDVLSLPRTWMGTELIHFSDRLGRYGVKVTLAEALLDQRIAAGCGNYIRADAMWLARFNPMRPASSLTQLEQRRMWVALFSVARSSELNHHSTIDLDDTPELTELNERLAGRPFDNLVYARSRSPLGGEVERYTDKNGRTVWYSPSEQRN